MIDSTKFTIIAGPCVIEGKDMLWKTAEKLVSICSKLDINFIFKSSYRKANRTSANAFTGIGDDLAIKMLNDIREEFEVPVLTDVHTVEEVKWAEPYVDIFQIPAFLSRQTELLEAAGRTGKYINIKKAQFMAPEDVLKAAEKVKNTGNNNILITERGTCFGYHDLIVDFRSMLTMKKSEYPVIYDATHSMQQPSIGAQSGGYPEFVESMAYSAVSLGIGGVFFETHPDPKSARSDAATQLSLDKAEKFIKNLVTLNSFIKENIIA